MSLEQVPENRPTGFREANCKRVEYSRERLVPKLLLLPESVEEFFYVQEK